MCKRKRAAYRTCLVPGSFLVVGKRKLVFHLREYRRSHRHCHPQLLVVTVVVNWHLVISENCQRNSFQLPRSKNTFDVMANT